MPPIGFHNGPAVRIAMAYGFLSILFLVVSGTLGAAAPFLMPVWLVAAGFLAVLAYRRRKNEAKGFSWQDYRDLIIITHRQLAAPLIWCWDNLNIHLAPELADFFLAG